MLVRAMGGAGRGNGWAGASSASIIDDAVVRGQAVAPGLGQGFVAVLEEGAQVECLARWRLNQERQAPFRQWCHPPDVLLQDFGAIECTHDGLDGRIVRK